jgi:hypothetical protein
VTYISDAGHISHSLAFNKQFGLDERLKLFDSFSVKFFELLYKITMRFLSIILYQLLSVIMQKGLM